MNVDLLRVDHDDDSREEGVVKASAVRWRLDFEANLDRLRALNYQAFWDCRTAGSSQGGNREAAGREEAREALVV